MSPSQNSYVFANLLIRSLLECLLWSLLHFRQLNINNSFPVDMYSRQDLQQPVHLLLRSTTRLSARLDNELDINLKLSIKFIFYVIALLFPISSFNGTEKVMYFSVFFSRHSICPLNSSASSLIIKWESYLEPFEILQ